ncbi:GNAT family N-acetyltransferase [Micromonospora inositola]|uniref:Acetyltransferase (GNAT) family protein n=1 Tax=Micromonospora inositola TaxID=47865 RepID=A0A1C5HI58_9ACTN|nr:GNAT family N-acetyltransferase [Micromonospora inositola]SCG45557.1 Acetyltransferase (GNAT) family protein [Micromonospora inositola]
MREFGPRVDLGGTLRALRRQADLSQRQLAERSGVPQATIARIESGRTADPTRLTGGGLPATSWRFLAELPDGELVGELRAHERSVDLLLGHDLDDRRELVLDGVLIDPAHRLLGVGRQLVEALHAEMDHLGVATVHAIAQFGGVGFLIACGFEAEWGRPSALRWERPVSAGRRPPR